MSFENHKFGFQILLEIFSNSVLTIKLMTTWWILYPDKSFFMDLLEMPSPWNVLRFCASESYAKSGLRVQATSRPVWD